MVKGGACSYKIDSKEILNLEDHLNRFVGSKNTAILVNRGILPSGCIKKGLRLQPAQQACLYMSKKQGPKFTIWRLY